MLSFNRRCITRFRNVASDFVYWPWRRQREISRRKRTRRPPKSHGENANRTVPYSIAKAHAINILPWMFTPHPVTRMLVFRGVWAPCFFFFWTLCAYDRWNCFKRHRVYLHVFLDAFLPLFVIHHSFSMPRAIVFSFFDRGWAFSIIFLPCPFDLFNVPDRQCVHTLDYRCACTFHCFYRVRLSPAISTRFIRVVRAFSKVLFIDAVWKILPRSVSVCRIGGIYCLCIL